MISPWDRSAGIDVYLSPGFQEAQIGGQVRHAARLLSLGLLAPDSYRRERAGGRGHGQGQGQGRGLGRAAVVIAVGRRDPGRRMSDVGRLSQCLGALVTCNVMHPRHRHRPDSRPPTSTSTPLRASSQRPSRDSSCASATRGTGASPSLSSRAWSHL